MVYSLKGLLFSSYAGSLRFLDFHEALRLVLPGNDEYARRGSASCGLPPSCESNRANGQSKGTDRWSSSKTAIYYLVRCREKFEQRAPPPPFFFRPCATKGHSPASFFREKNPGDGLKRFFRTLDDQGDLAPRSSVLYGVGR